MQVVVEAVRLVLLVLVVQAAVVQVLVEQVAQMELLEQ
jgi:hypothetical protein